MGLEAGNGALQNDWDSTLSAALTRVVWHPTFHQHVHEALCVFPQQLSGGGQQGTWGWKRAGSPSQTTGTGCWQMAVMRLSRHLNFQSM